jgi:protein-S-isoprenylcysteine O-methyltransferase Ste14
VISHINQIFQLVWIGWAISWLTASFWSARTQSQVSLTETWTYRAALIAGAIMLAPWSAWVLGESPLWTIGFYGGASLLIAMLAGLYVTWWARIYLGRFWSGVITRKEHHTLVDTGPYAFTRHPIYTGLVTALLVTGVAEATIAALLGAGIMIFGFWLKARAEEQFLLFELGPDVYRAYCRRVPMLVPFASSRGLRISIMKAPDGNPR